MSTTDFDPYLDFDLTVLPPPKPNGPIPVWEIATMFPPQGEWTEEEYLQLTDSTNRLIEYTDGAVEFLPMPTFLHQVLLAELFKLFSTYAEKYDPAWVLPAGLRVRMPDKMFREPDLVYLRKASQELKRDRFVVGADLVVEIVSPDDRSIARDYKEKVAVYAAAGIAEYWIVDPQESKITVLTLPEGKSEYAEHGVFHSGETATSKLLEGFVVDVKACFDAAKA